MIKLQAANAIALIEPLGAELKSLIVNNVELMYTGAPGYWQRTSPVLFPIVGRLLHNTYSYGNTTYSMGQHGFARDQMFVAQQTQPNSAQFTLLSTEQTMQMYPFAFALTIIYTLSPQQLQVQYLVANTQNSSLYYSIGAHPAFSLSHPLQQYSITIDTAQHNAQWFGLDNGCPAPMPTTLSFQNLKLSPQLFSHDTVILKQATTHTQLFYNGKLHLGIRATAPFFGIWKQPNSPFICLEPWWGVADSAQATGQLQAKEGIIHLPAQQINTHDWSIYWLK